MAKTEKLGNVKGLGEIYRIYAPFDKELEEFHKSGIKMPVSVRDACLIRLAGLSADGTRTCHAPIYHKDSPTIIARVSPLVKDLEMARQAVSANRDGRYPIFSDSIYAEFEKIARADKGKKPEKRRAIILPQRQDFKIQEDSEEAEFFFQDARKGYFRKFLPGGSVQIYQIDKDKIDSQNGSIVNYVWLDGPEYSSYLVLGNRVLDCDDGAFGVLKKGARGTFAKISGKAERLVRPYTERESQRYIRILEKVMSGESGTSRLEKLLQHFRK